MWGIPRGLCLASLCFCDESRPMYSLNLYESTAAFFWCIISLCRLPLSILCHLCHMAQAIALPMHLDFQYDWRTSTWKLCAIKSWSVTPWVYMMMCRYAESIGATHFVTSAKLNAGINEVFLDVAHRKCSYLLYRCSWTMVRVQCIWRGSEDYGVRNQNRFTVKELPHTADLACLSSFQGCKQLPI